MVEVYLNSKFIGTVDDASSFTAKIREERRSGNITSNLNVHHNDKSNEVLIETARGRARKPLIVVRDSQPLLTEKYLKQLEKNEISLSNLLKQRVI